MKIRERPRQAKRKKGAICRVTAAFLSAAAAVFLLLASCPSKPTVWTAYTVSCGDTLWTIARNEYGDSVDIRKKIAEICAENDITPNKLIAGDVILIPVTEAHK